MYEFLNFEDDVTMNDVTFKEEIIGEILRARTSTVDESEFEDENKNEEVIKTSSTDLLNTSCCI